MSLLPATVVFVIVLLILIEMILSGEMTFLFKDLANDVKEIINGIRERH